MKKQAVVVHALVQNKQGHYKNHIYCFFLGLLELRRTMSSCARITQRLPQNKAQAYHVFFVCVHSGFIQILAGGEWGEVMGAEPAVGTAAEVATAGA